MEICEIRRLLAFSRDRFGQKRKKRQHFCTPCIAFLAMPWRFRGCRGAVSMASPALTSAVWLKIEAQLRRPSTSATEKLAEWLAGPR